MDGQTGALGWVCLRGALCVHPKDYNVSLFATTFRYVLLVATIFNYLLLFLTLTPVNVDLPSPVPQGPGPGL